MSLDTSYSAFVMAMERVEQRLRTVTAALDAARIPYAVIGGNAVATWVAQVDPAATRTTKAVDLLITEAVRAALPVDLRARLDEIARSLDAD
ncbi:MAG: hypothetical protein AB1716_20960 [Planctomycetota bacterium]